MRTCKMPFVAAIAAAAFTIGCAAPGPTATVPPVSMRTADAVIYVNGLV